MRTNTRKWSLASSIAGPFLQTVGSRVTEAWLKRQRSPCSPWVVAIGMVAIGMVANEDSRSVFILVWEIAKYQTVHSSNNSPRKHRNSSHRYSHSVVGASNRVAEDGKRGQTRNSAPEQIGRESILQTVCLIIMFLHYYNQIIMPQTIIMPLSIIKGQQNYKPYLPTP